jgi:MFS family permease
MRAPRRLALLAVIAATTAGVGSAPPRGRSMLLSRTLSARATAPRLRMRDADDARAAARRLEAADDAAAPMLALEREGAEGEGVAGWRARALLPALLSVSVHNQFARALVFYVVDFGPRSTVEPAATRDLMNVELGFGPETYGLLASVPFTLLFAPVSLLAGAAADVSDRARLTWLPLVCWSAATAWQASSGSVGEVAASRALQGLAMAFTTPAAFTLLADTSPPARRATVFSAYSTGVYVGGGLAALSILLDQAVGWRSTLRIGAAVGLGLAAVTALTVEDPRTVAAARREPSAAAPPPELRALVRAQADALGRTFAVVAERPEVMLLLASCALRLCAGFSIAVWVGPWGRTAFPAHEGDFAIAKALISAVGGSASVRAGSG